MQSLSATVQSDSDWSSVAAPNLFDFRGWVTRGNRSSHPPPLMNTPPQPSGPEHFMHTFNVTEDGLVEQGMETISAGTRFIHEEPAWRAPAEPAGLIAVVLADDLAALAERLHDPSIQAYIDGEDDSGRSALDHALERKAFRAARMLVQRGAKIADEELLNPKLLVDLMQADEWVFAKQVARSRQLLVTKLDTPPPNDHFRMRQPLYTAILGGDIEMTSVLWNPLGFDLRDESGNTFLHYGAASVNSHMLPFLLSQLPADQAQRQALLDTTRSDGSTSLVQATLSNRPTAVAVLLRAGAALDIADHKGESAIHKAARDGLLEVGRLLLAMGARTDLRNAHQQTPLAMAHAYGRPDFVQLLGAFGVSA